MNADRMVLSVSVIGACLLSTGAAAQDRTSTPIQSPPITKDALLPGDPGRPPWPVDNSTLLVVMERIGWPPQVIYRNLETYETDAEWHSSKYQFKWWTKVAGAYFGQDFIIDFAPYDVNNSGKEYWLEIQPVDRNKQPLAPPSHPMIIRFVVIPR